MGENVLAVLNVNADCRLLSAVESLVAGVAESQSISSPESAELGKLAKDALDYLIGINLPQSGTSSIAIALSTRVDQFVVAIEHQGLPIDLRSDVPLRSSPFSLSIRSPVVDEVGLVNLGKVGQRFEFIKYLDRLNPEESQSCSAIPSKAGDISVITNHEKIYVREVLPDEGLKVARCFYRVYGYTYGPGYVYFPDRLKSMIEAGNLVSMGAFDTSGEIVAHGAMILDPPESTVGELISLAVDPLYRGAGLAAKIHVSLLDFARKKKMKGLIGEAVTLHPYSQKLCLGLGGKESAIMVGYVPPSDYKRISTGEVKGRQLAVVYFFGLSDSAESYKIFAPQNYRDIIEKIYFHLGLTRELLSESAVPWGSQCGETAFNVRVYNEVKMASISIESYCPDTSEIVGLKLRELVELGIEYIYLDLPLSDPLTPYFAQDFESSGFFFSGVIPYFLQTDALRLQFVNTRAINFREAVIASEFGRELTSYVMSKKQSTTFPP